MIRINRRLGIAGIVVVLTLATLNANAGEDVAAQKAKAAHLFEEGKTHFKLGEFKSALDSFKEAYRLAPLPAILYNIAQCYRQLNDKENAVRSYRAFLNDAPDVPNRGEVEAIIAKLREQIASESQRRQEQKPAAIGQDRASANPPIAETKMPSTTVEQRSVSPNQLTAKSEPAPAKPIYKRWWLWTTVGAIAAVGVGVGLGVGLGSPSTHYPSASPSDGAIRF